MKSQPVENNITVFWSYGCSAFREDGLFGMRAEASERQKAKFQQSETS
jgi:hypothetical protein